MISWSTLVISGIWIVGAAWVLAAVSFKSSILGGTLPALWRALLDNRWVRPGALLVCASMAAAATDWPMRVLWGLLCLGLLYGWWKSIERGRGRGRTSAQVRGDASPLAPAGELVASTSVRTRRRSSPITVAAEWVVRTELLWLGLLSPFFLFPAPGRVWALLGLPVLWVARRVARNRFLPRTPLDLALAILMLMVLVSLFVTFDVTLSLGKIAPLLWGIGVYYAIVEWASTPGKLRWAMGAYATAGVGLAVAGLLGTAWAIKVPVLSRIAVQLPSLIRGLPGEESGFNPNIVGGSLLWVVPLQMSLWAATRGGRGTAWVRLAERWGLILALAVSGGALLLMQSRSALASFALGAVLLLWLGVRRARPVLVALLLGGLAALAFIGPQKVAGALFNSSITSSQASQSSQSLQSRLETWSRAVHMIQDFSFTGMGMGTFSELMPIMYPTSGLAPVDTINHAHNQLLQAALNLGLPGLVAFLAIWMVAGALVVISWRSSTDRWNRAATAGVGAGLLAHFVFGLTDAVVLVARPSVFFWALLGLLVALWKQSGAQTRIV